MPPEVVAEAITEGFGYEVPVECRSGTEFRNVAKGHPFLSKAQEHKALHVAFLMSKPSAPNGIGRSKLTNKYFDSKLGTTSTFRNWKTVLRLAAMLDD